MVHEACLADRPNLWMQVPPTEFALLVPSFVFHTLMPIIIGLPHPVLTAVFADFAAAGRGVPQCCCGAALDAFGLHLLGCMHCRPGRVPVHDALKYALAAALARIKDADVAMEKHVLNVEKRADVVARFKGLATQVFEVTTRAPWAATHLKKHDDVDSVLKAAEQKKKAEYPELNADLNPNAAQTLLVIAAAMLGRLNAAGVSAMDDLIRYHAHPFAAAADGTAAMRAKARRTSARWQQVWRQWASAALACAVAALLVERIRALVTGDPAPATPLRKEDGSVELLKNGKPRFEPGVFRNGGLGKPADCLYCQTLDGHVDNRAREEEERANFFLRRRRPVGQPFDPATADLVLCRDRPGAAGSRGDRPEADLRLSNTFPAKRSTNFAI